MNTTGVAMMTALCAAGGPGESLRPNEVPPHVYFDRSGVPELVVHNALLGASLAAGAASVLLEDDLQQAAAVSLGAGVGVGLSLWLAIYFRDGGLTFYGTKAAFVGYSTLPRFIMVFALASLLGSYGLHARGWLGQRISAAGRAAFTNYLGTSIVMLFVVHGWALGLFGQLNRPQLYLVTFLTWCLMLAWSKPWLERYRYGPLEWLWRCLTYGKLFTNRR